MGTASNMAQKFVWYDRVCSYVFFCETSQGINMGFSKISADMSWLPNIHFKKYQALNRKVKHRSVRLSCVLFSRIFCSENFSSFFTFFSQRANSIFVNSNFNELSARKLLVKSNKTPIAFKKVSGVFFDDPHFYKMKAVILFI